MSEQAIDVLSDLLEAVEDAAERLDPCDPWAVACDGIAIEIAGQIAAWAASLSSSVSGDESSLLPEFDYRAVCERRRRPRKGRRI